MHSMHRGLIVAASRERIVREIFDAMSKFRPTVTAVICQSGVDVPHYSFTWSTLFVSLTLLEYS